MHFHSVNLNSRPAFPRWIAVACAAIASALPLSAQVPEHPGAAIYRKLCLDCHGKNGEGVPDKYDEPLHGNRTVEGLAKRIARTMPDDNVGACVGDDAAQVAAYIYEAFYSPRAFARLRPPEFDLARLTIPQYRTAVADLVGRFRPGFDRPPGAVHGLKARYSGVVIAKPEAAPEAAKPGEKKKEPEKMKFERMDAQVAFSYGAGSPDPEKMSPDSYEDFKDWIELQLRKIKRSIPLA